MSLILATCPFLGFAKEAGENVILDCGLTIEEYANLRSKLLGPSAEEKASLFCRDLKNLGLNPREILRDDPNLLIVSHSVPEFVNALKNLGFKDPAMMIKNSPNIFGLNPRDNIPRKIESLRQLGFDSPVEFYETTPNLLSLSVELNFAEKIKTLQRHGFENPVQMIKRFPCLLAYDSRIESQPELLNSLT